MRKLLLIASLLLAFQAPAQAGMAVPTSYSGRVNNAIGANLRIGMQKRGFAANDPRYNATVDAVSSTATSVAVAVGGGVLAGATWPAILAGAGISAVASLAVPWVVNKAIDWYWGQGADAGKVLLGGADMAGDKTKLPAMPSRYTDPALSSVGTKFFYDPYGGVVRQFMTIQVEVPRYANPTAPYNNTFLQEDFQTPWDGKTDHRYWSRSANTYVSTATTDTYTQVWELVTPSTKPITAPYTAGYVKPADLPANLPADAANQPITAKMLADAINALWKQAAANNPDIAPYPASDPITAAEVQPWIDANPANAPKGQDWFSPVAPTNTTTVPLTSSATTPTPDPGTDTGGSTSPSTALCGLTGQPRCGVDVDDSGFQDSRPDASGATSWLDRMVDDFNGRVNGNQDDHGIKWRDWFPDLRFGAPRVACEPLSIDLSGIVSGWKLSIDICTNPLILLIKQVEAWLLYAFTAIYIWRRFRSSEVPGGAEA